MRPWWAVLIVWLVVTWLSCGVANTDMHGEWLFDKPTSLAIKAAIRLMGPMYSYRTLWTGELQVNKYTGDDDDERWERLRY